MTFKIKTYSFIYKFKINAIDVILGYSGSPVDAPPGYTPGWV